MNTMCWPPLILKIHVEFTHKSSCLERSRNYGIQSKPLLMYYMSVTLIAKLPSNALNYWVKNHSAITFMEYLHKVNTQSGTYWIWRIGENQEGIPHSQRQVQSTFSDCNQSNWTLMFNAKQINKINSITFEFQASNECLIQQLLLT